MPSGPLSDIAEAFGYSYGRTSQILCSPAAKEYLRKLEDRIITESIKTATIFPEPPVVSDVRPSRKKAADGRRLATRSRHT